MFLAIGTYTTEWTKDDPLYAAHRDHMVTHVDSGALLCSGPRAGGGSVLIGNGTDRAAFQSILDSDPFRTAGYVEFEVHEFTPGLVDERIGFDLVTGKSL
ncbi:YciI family protein [Salinibacterium sp. ZJ454]|uniref:YciI family protein n=1 Tax=Salinibacterium sp. ZJ454 TaxID=2708339 RepID=UPI0014242B86|nr:YciI family protein [Salinibacterium sp. ZJ454]